MNLDSPIEDLPKVGPILSNKLDKLGIKTLKNLLNHVPSRYVDYSEVTKVRNLRAGETVTIHAKMSSLKNVFSRRGLRMQIGAVEDDTGKLAVVWFNQPFLIKMLYPGRAVSLSGKIGFFNRKLCLTSPDYEILDTEDSQTLHTGRLVPIYPETSGLSSKWIRRLIKEATSYKDVIITDPLPQTALKKFKLLSLKKAFIDVHFPKTLKNAEKGRERLAFDELLNLQLKSLYRKNNWKKYKVANKLHVEKGLIKQFINQLPFKLTTSQLETIKELAEDLAKETPMNRLLEGDVGSGKTIVAAAGIFLSFTSGYQSVIMAPTQILALQHYETLKNIFKPFNIRVSLVTADVKRIELGRSDVFVGTHSLIHSKVKFDKVSFVVIDEQHRFGVEQRRSLIKKSETPHVLTMTATPIPRTVALTTYGDLDLSTLREMPKGRKEITTWVVPEQKRKSAYDWIKSEIIKNKSQAFIVCPLIEDSDSETLADVKSVTSEFERLKRIFDNNSLGLLHGRLRPKEKEVVLEGYRKGQIDILVTTPVVEVGIDIPNATIMVIEAAERFGLAQLHQLRGRVGRSEKKSYSLLFSNYSSGNAFKRLKAMEKSQSGFELAELDLKMRGPGEIFGTAQSGFPELKIASWSNFKLISDSKKLAEEIVTKPKLYSQVAFDNLPD